MGLKEEMQNDCNNAIKVESNDFDCNSFEINECNNKCAIGEDCGFA